MSISRKRRAQNLAEWLEIATEKLSHPAKSRISADITSHYDEAVHGHVQNGLPAPAAQVAALAELGDEKAAARRFRRAHLTQSEFRKVAALVTYARNWTTLPFELAFSFFYWTAVCESYDGPGPKILATVLFALLFVCRIAIFALARRNTGVPIPRLFVLIVSVLFLDMGFLFIIVGDIGLHPQGLEEWVYLAVGLECSLLMFAGSLDCFRLRNRLGKMAEDWMGETGNGRMEIPPDKPVAS